MISFGSEYIKQNTLGKIIMYKYKDKQLYLIF